MSIFDKAILASDKVIAEAIQKAVVKKEAVNKILGAKQLNYRIGDIDLEMGIPPKIVFSVRELEQEA